MPPQPLTPRVAFFPDSFHEINGVANTSRRFVQWAEDAGMPMLCVRAGNTPGFTRHGSVEALELRRGFTSIALEKDLSYDPLFARHIPKIVRALRAFRPDLIHITGPSELGALGAVLSHFLKIPLAASWHTNIHEYAAKRAGWALRLLPQRLRLRAAAWIERASRRGAALFYRSARLLFAPNPQLCDWLASATGRPCLLMSRGIDAALFSPARRTAPQPVGSGWTLGYVGRLSVEKNVALLPKIDRALRAKGLANFRFLIVGHGAEEAALRAALPDAAFPGVLRGEVLARAYADMDCFLFPSHTDTFGNVVLEAMSSGVPAVVTPDGGPAHIVHASGGGMVAKDEEFADAVASLMADPARYASLQTNARNYALSASWDSVFTGMYTAYEQYMMKPAKLAGRQ